MKEAHIEDWVQVPLSKGGILGKFSACVHFASFWNVKLRKPAKFHDGIIFCTIVVITDLTRVGNESC